MTRKKLTLLTIELKAELKRIIDMTPKERRVMIETTSGWKIENSHAQGESQLDQEITNKLVQWAVESILSLDE